MPEETEPKVKVVFQSACVVKNRRHVALGEVREYDVEDDATELQHLRAAGRIAPVTKDNLETLFDLMQSAGAKAPASLVAAAKELKLQVPDSLLAEKTPAEKK